MMKNQVHVLVVDDSIAYQRIVTDAISVVPDIEVVGTAANGKIALAMIESLNPDVLTLDLVMPEMSGLELLGQLGKSNDSPATVVLSSTTTPGAKATLKALDLGAFDFVTKPVGCTPEESMQSLRTELIPRIMASHRGRHARKTRRGQGASNSPVGAKQTAAIGANVARGSRRLVGDGAGPVDVVAIGISTGGPLALNRMLPQLPADLRAAVLIVQHIPKHFTKPFAENLDKECAISVSEAIDGQPILPGQVLIAPGGKQMKVVRERGRTTVRITNDPPEQNCRPSVDYLFRSVNEIYGPNAVGVIMTGMGTDGVQGCRRMKERGATIIAQDEETCVVFGMSRELVEQGIADVVAPLNEIAAEITGLVMPRGVLCT